MDVLFIVLYILLAADSLQLNKFIGCNGLNAETHRKDTSTATKARKHKECIWIILPRFFFGENETEAHYIKPSCQPQIYTDEHRYV